MTGIGAPQVSVLMSVHNAERFVAEAVRSILGQSFGDFEFLILDDGSTDGSRAILERLAAGDPRIRLTVRENRGLTASLNELIGQARGAYFARMDADDIARPERFALQVARMAADPRLGALGGSVRFIDDDGRPVVDKKALLTHQEIDASNLAGRAAIAHPAVMLRRAAVEAVGGYDESFVTTQELDLFLKIAEGWRLANLPEIVLDYRFAETSVSAGKSRVQAEMTERACRAAWVRRGLSDQKITYRDWRPAGGRRARAQFALDWAWLAWSQGYQGTARHYFLKAVRLDPLSLAAWKGAVFGNLRTRAK